VSTFDSTPRSAYSADVVIGVDADDMGDGGIVYEITGLQAGQAYYIRARAYNGVAEANIATGDISSTATCGSCEGYSWPTASEPSFVVLMGSATAPRQVAVSSRQSYSQPIAELTVVWEEPTDLGGSAIEEYKVEWWPAALNVDEVQSISLTNTHPGVTGGLFAVSWKGNKMTVDPFVTADNLRKKLMRDLETGHVTVSRSIELNGFKWSVTFVDYDGDVPPMLVETGTLSDGGGVLDLWLDEDTRGISTAGVNEVQVVTTSGTGLGGFFRLHFAASGIVWADAMLLSYDASEAEMEMSLEDLLDVGKVGVTRTDLGGDLYAWEVTFISTRFNSWDVPVLTANVDLLTGTDEAITVEDGDNAIDESAEAAVACADCVVGETPSGYDFTLVPSAYRSASIDNLNPGETYTVRVTAVNARGLGAAFGPYPQLTLPLQAPSIPLAVTADVDFGMPHNIQVTYSTPASDGGSPILKYKLEWCKLEDGASASECFSGQPEGGTVVNAAGQPLESSNVRCPTSPRREVFVVQATPDGGGSLGGQFKLKLTRGGTDSFTGAISFDAKGTRAEESATNVDVFCNDDSGFSCEAGDNSPRGSVQSHLEALHDVNGDILNQITYGSVEVTRVDHGGDAYKWSVTFHDDGSDFQLEVEEDSVTNADVTVVREVTGYVYGACEGTVTIIDTLDNGVEYLVRVSAVNRIGYSPGAIIAQPQKPMVVPDPPHSVALVVQSDTSLRVTFLAPQDDPSSSTRADGGDTITEYIVEADESPAFDSGLSRVFNGQYEFKAQHIGNIYYLEAGGTFVYTFTGLTMGTFYYVRVKAYNSQGYGAAQSSSPALESPKRVPSGPQNVYMHITSHQLLTVQVVYPGDTGGEDASNYKVEHDVQYGQDSFEAPPNKGMNTIAAPVDNGIDATPDAYFTVEGLSDIQNYFFRVSAANSMGYGSPTVSVPAYAMPTLQVPGIPTQVSVTGGGATGEITVIWSPPVIPAHGIPCSGNYSHPGPCPNTMGRGSEADGGAPIDAYYVQYSESATFDSGEGDEIYVAANLGAGASYTHDLVSLDPDKLFYIRVRAKNSQGEGGNCGNEADPTSGRCSGDPLNVNPAS